MSNKINLAIVGSRNFNDYNTFTHILLKFLDEWDEPIIEQIISGGASGTDTLANIWATDNYIPIQVFKPNWKLYGNSAGPRRNTLIVEEATHVIAFPSKTGKGTQDTIKKAKNKGVPIKIHYID